MHDTYFVYVIRRAVPSPTMKTLRRAAVINQDKNTRGLTSGVSCARWQAFGYHELITGIAELSPLDRFEILQELDGLPDSDPYRIEVARQCISDSNWTISRLGIMYTNKWINQTAFRGSAAQHRQTEEGRPINLEYAVTSEESEVFSTALQNGNLLVTEPHEYHEFWNLCRRDRRFLVRHCVGSSSLNAEVATYIVRNMIEDEKIAAFDQYEFFVSLLSSPLLRSTYGQSYNMAQIDFMNLLWESIGAWAQEAAQLIARSIPFYLDNGVSFLTDDECQKLPSHLQFILRQLSVEAARASS